MTGICNLEVKSSFEFRVMARAKVNLALHVTDQLSNGLHLLDSLVAFPNIGDELFFQKSDRLTLVVDGPFGKALSNDSKASSNLVYRAASLIKKPGDGAHIRLKKNLPLASGIGGGSSDAAQTLKALSKIWSRPMPQFDELLNLGSDIPICLSNSFQRLGGVGDIVEVIPSPPPIWIVLVNPGVKVSTSKVFQCLKSKKNAPLEDLTDMSNQHSLCAYLSRQRNDLEVVTRELVPEVGLLLDLFEKNESCKCFRMSGSGATCFGLYFDKESAESEVTRIKKTFPHYWVEVGELFSSNS